VKLLKFLKLPVLILLVPAFGGIMPLQALEKGAESSDKPGRTVSNPDSLRKKRNDLDSTIVYTARDSLVYHIGQRSADLFGKARVDYKESRIEAPRITVLQPTTTIHAGADRDSTGTLTERPVFTDKAGSFQAETMEYNYTSRVGTASALTSRDQLGIYSGKDVRRLPSGELLIDHGIYTTCDLDEPHYWFSGKKMSIVPGERIVARPFVMYIHPELFSRRLPVMPILWLPYLSAPISSKRSSGFLFPRVGSSHSRGGFFFSNLGYFWAINDYADLRAVGDISLNGSWKIGERFRYKNRDVYSGSFEGDYETIELNKPGDSDYARFVNRNFRLNHHQLFDPTATLDINYQYIGGNRYYSASSVNPETVITQQATSYASFSKSWDQGNRVMIAGYQRVDNLESGDLTQVATASLYQNRIYPFRSFSGISDSDWRLRLSLQPAISASGQFVSNDSGYSDLFTGNAGLDVEYLQDFAPGYRARFTQGINVQAQRKITTLTDDLGAAKVQLPFSIHTTLFGYLNLTPSLTYTRYRVNSTVRKFYDSATSRVVTETVHQPDDYETIQFSLETQTRLYGMLNTGFLEPLTGISALRHTVIPTVSLTCNPDYRGSGYDNYGTVYDPVSQSLVRYNRFGESLYSGVPEKQTTLGITFQNLLQGRFRTADVAKGRRYRTMSLFSLTASSGYNFAADSLRAQPLVLTASSSAFSPALLLSAGSTYDFYTVDPSSGNRIDRLAVDDNKGLLRFVSGFLNMSVSFSGTLRSTYPSSDTGDGTLSVVRQDASPVETAIYRDRFNIDELVKFSESLPWSLRLSLYLSTDKSDPLNPVTMALLNSAAKLSLSKNWQVGLNSGLDLDRGRFVYPALMIYRDLHDFQFSGQWVPSGQYRGYLLQIAMKPAHLRYLKVQAAGGNAAQGLQ
jgi:lipopolysaccharide assembly outer membrane protein LptD (OstA)